MRRRFAALLTIVLAATLFAATPAAAHSWTTPANRDKHERWAFCAINQARRDAGLAPYAWDPALAKSARAWSQTMVAERKLFHDPDMAAVAAEIDPRWRWAAENVGYHPYAQAASMHHAFMTSTGHHFNIMFEEGNRGAVGVAFDANGGLWITQRFIAGTPIANGDTCPDGPGSVPPGVPLPGFEPPPPPPTSPPPPPAGGPPKPGGFYDVPSSAYYAQAVAWAAHNKITTGTSATTFAPNENVTRGQIATFLWRHRGTPKGTGRLFADVPSNAYYANAVRWMRGAGLTTGVGGSNYYKPNDSASRAELITLLWRSAGSPNLGTNHGFRDVPKGAYYERAVTWAVRKKITTGTSTTTFAPTERVTRAQTVTLLWRMAGSPF